MILHCHIDLRDVLLSKRVQSVSDFSIANLTFTLGIRRFCNSVISTDDVVLNYYRETAVLHFHIRQFVICEKTELRME